MQENVVLWPNAAKTAAFQARNEFPFGNHWSCLADPCLFLPDWVPWVDLGFFIRMTAPFHGAVLVNQRKQAGLKAARTASSRRGKKTAAPNRGARERQGWGL